MNMIGERCRALREASKLSQKEMATILGISQPSMNRYENGISSPSPEVLTAIADYFDVSMDYIYGRTENPQGKLYQYKPESFNKKIKQNKDMKEFIEMCFDPKSEISSQLKASLLKLMEEKQECQKEP